MHLFNPRQLEKFTPSLSLLVFTVTAIQFFSAESSIFNSTSQVDGQSGGGTAGFRL